MRRRRGEKKRDLERDGGSGESNVGNSGNAKLESDVYFRRV